MPTPNPNLTFEAGLQDISGPLTPNREEYVRGPGQNPVDPAAAGIDQSSVIAVGQVTAPYVFAGHYY